MSLNAFLLIVIEADAITSKELNGLGTPSTNRDETVRLLKAIRDLLGVFAMVLLTSSNIQANSWNKSFVMHTAEPLVAGNKLLVPGNYVWKLMDSESNRHIVQISNQTTGQVETTIFAFPKYRAEPPSRNEIGYWETPAGRPRAVRTWFYPGDNYGQEFAYPKNFKLLTASYHSSRTFARRPMIAEAEAPKPKATTTSTVNPAAEQPAAKAGSWAIITNGGAGSAASNRPDAKQKTGLWDKIKKLPLTATLAPLIGLIGIGFLVMYLLSYVKRQQRAA